MARRDRGLTSFFFAPLVAPALLQSRRLADCLALYPGRSLQSTSSGEVGEFWCARTGALLFALSKALIHFLRSSLLRACR